MPPAKGKGMFGLVHLIILLVRLLSGASGGSAQAPRIGSKRRNKAGQVTLECPFCQHLGVATQHNLDQWTGRVWQREMETYECPKCRRAMNAEAMQNDGTGVLTAKTWECPSCRSRNLAVRFDCQTCGLKLQ